MPVWDRLAYVGVATFPVDSACSQRENESYIEVSEGPCRGYPKSPALEAVDETAPGGGLFCGWLLFVCDVATSRRSMKVRAALGEAGSVG